MTEREATYTVVFNNQPPHLCGLNIGTMFDQLPVGSVIQCNIDGRLWKKRARSGQTWTTWTWEKPRETRKRLKRDC